LAAARHLRDLDADLVRTLDISGFEICGRKMCARHDRVGIARRAIAADRFFENVEAMLRVVRGNRECRCVEGARESEDVAGRARFGDGFVACNADVVESPVTIRAECFLCERPREFGPRSDAAIGCRGRARGIERALHAPDVETKKAQRHLQSADRARIAWRYDGERALDPRDAFTLER